MKTFPIHLPNGATVCTPDSLALKAREARCKRVTRSNRKEQATKLEQARKLDDKRLSTREKIIDGLLGSLMGVICFVGPFFLVAI